MQIIGFLGPKTHRKDTGSFCARVVRYFTPFGTCICPNPDRYLFNFREFSVSDTKFQMDDFPKWILKGKEWRLAVLSAKNEFFRHFYIDIGDFFWKRWKIKILDPAVHGRGRRRQRN